MRPTFILPTIFHLATLFAVSPLIRARPSDPHGRSLGFSQRRDLRPQQRQVVPVRGTSVGCYTDDVSARTLSSESYMDVTDMTVESCETFCYGNGYIYAGVELGYQCYCGYFISQISKLVSPSDCNFKCTGNASETCGAANRLNIYWSGEAPPPSLPFGGEWTYEGCYTGGTLRFNRDFSGGTANNDVESCIEACFASDYPFAGMEDSEQCYCDTAINGAPAFDDCYLPCQGNDSEICGGPSYQSVYAYVPPKPNPSDQ